MLRLGLPRFFAMTLLVAALGACGDDDDGNEPEDGGPDAMTEDPGMDGGGGQSGASGRSGSGGAGGAAGAPDAGEPYQCEPTVPEPEPGGSADEGEACCGGLGSCMSNVSGPGTTAYGLDDCQTGEGLKCVPLAADPAADAGADDDAGSAPALASCRMTLPNATSGEDFEGRCIPSCFLTGDRSTANLAQATCDAGNKCVPCYSPITGASTGACERDGDAPVDPAPAGFAECGDGDIGFCIPSASAGMVATLPQLTCDDGQVCAPKSRVLDQGSCFARCESPFGPGACIAAFIVGAQGAALQMGSCMTGELCVPCISPLDMMRTGACD